MKGEGHLLGETAGQFFSEGYAGDVFRACERKDWKTVKQLSQNLAPVPKPNARDVCETAKHVRQQATSGTRVEYSGRGDEEAMRTDWFTFDGGYLVRIHMVYTAPVANMEGFHPKSFSELFAGLAIDGFAGNVCSVDTVILRRPASHPKCLVMIRHAWWTTICQSIERTGPQGNLGVLRVQSYKTLAQNPPTLAGILDAQPR